MLLLGVGGVIIWLALKAKSIKETFRFLEYMPAGVSFKLEGFAPVLFIKLKIYNPNKTAIPINGVLGQIFYKGNAIASFTNTGKVSINGNETTTVDMKARISLTNIAIAAFSKDTKKVIDVDGLIKTGFTDIPFGYSYNFASKVASKKVAAVKGIGYRQMNNSQVNFIDAFHPNTFPCNQKLKRSA
jgi:hypothetical protein